MKPGYFFKKHCGPEKEALLSRGEEVMSVALWSAVHAVRDLEKMLVLQPAGGEPGGLRWKKSTKVVRTWSWDILYCPVAPC